MRLSFEKPKDVAFTFNTSYKVPENEIDIILKALLFTGNFINGQSSTKHNTNEMPRVSLANGLPIFYIFNTWFDYQKKSNDQTKSIDTVIEQTKSNTGIELRFNDLSLFGSKSSTEIPLLVEYAKYKNMDESKSAKLDPPKM